MVFDMTAEPLIVPYSYDLPDERIAQRPVSPPESAKMLVYSRHIRAIEHATFGAIGQYLRAGDHLVFNDTKVIPARLFGALETADGYGVEVVLVREEARNEWSALGFPMRRIRTASVVYFNEKLRAVVLPSPVEDRLRLRFETDSADAISDLLHQHGTMPIPPYIRDGKGDDQDRVDYQSVFAQHPGSVAAPTASLHFTHELVAHLQQQVGCKVDRLTLHVGTASFQPIYVNGVLRPPAGESLQVSSDVWGRLEETKAQGGRVIAIGTTVVRALESVARNKVLGEMNETELFIEPGFQFKVVDALVTNFHQPRTTHLLLVEALLSREGIDACYTAALDQGYRFLSYGDGMLIL
jgi:S-adenosylmethionine:tRNA ribosyltransferase-isomerase